MCSQLFCRGPAALCLPMVACSGHAYMCSDHHMVTISANSLTFKSDPVNKQVGLSMGQSDFPRTRCVALDAPSSQVRICCRPKYKRALLALSSLPSPNASQHFIFLGSSVSQRYQSPHLSSQLSQPAAPTSLPKAHSQALPQTQVKVSQVYNAGEAGSAQNHQSYSTTRSSPRLFPPPYRKRQGAKEVTPPPQVTLR